MTGRQKGRQTDRKISGQKEKYNEEEEEKEGKAIVIVKKTEIEG